jgi:hypothetical protein
MKIIIEGKEGGMAGKEVVGTHKNDIARSERKNEKKSARGREEGGRRRRRASMEGKRTRSGQKGRAKG